MDIREPPTTDHDLLVRIWTILEGTNGSGLITKFSCLEDDVAQIKIVLPNLWTRTQHEDFIEDDEKKNDRRKISQRDWMLIAMTFIGPILAIGFSVLIH